MKFTTALAALALLLAACGSDGGDTATDASTESTTASDEATEPSTVADETSTTVAGDEATETTAVDTGTGDGELGPLLSAVFANAGVDPSPETIACIQDRGADIEVDLVSATEDEVAAATVGAFACAADDLAPGLASTITPPDGVEAADVECVVAETFRYFGDIPTDEAMAALDAPSIPDEFRDALLPVAQAACDLDADQIDAILEAT